MNKIVINKNKHLLKYKNIKKDKLTYKLEKIRDTDLSTKNKI